MTVGIVIVSYLLFVWGVVRFFQALREMDNKMSGKLRAHVISRNRFQ